MENWKIINDCSLIVNWIYETDDKNNASKRVIDLWNEKFHSKYQGQRLFNEGLLIMASYLMFVYVKEKLKSSIDYEKINFGEFKITEVARKHSNEEFIQRLRNSIAHGNFEIIGENIFFEDCKKNSQNKNTIRFNINKVKFGEFLSNYLYEVKNQLINN